MRDNVQVAFTGDRQWLVTGTRRHGYQLWQVGTWQPGPYFPTEQEVIPQVALTRDGKILAITPAPNVIRLLDLDTFRELATLRAPETRSIFWLCFSRDSNLLAAACDNQVIQVWDLRHLRQELATGGLDWGPVP
jgi:WD40 repeat protein